MIFSNLDSSDTTRVLLLPGDFGGRHFKWVHPTLTLCPLPTAKLLVTLSFPLLFTLPLRFKSTSRDTSERSREKEATGSRWHFGLILGTSHKSPNTSSMFVPQINSRLKVSNTTLIEKPTQWLFHGFPPSLSTYLFLPWVTSWYILCFQQFQALFVKPWSVSSMGEWTPK